MKGTYMKRSAEHIDVSTTRAKYAKICVDAVIKKKKGKSKKNARICKHVYCIGAIIHLENISFCKSLKLSTLGHRYHFGWVTTLHYSSAEVNVAIKNTVNFQVRSNGGASNTCFWGSKRMYLLKRIHDYFFRKRGENINTAKERS